MGIARTRKLLLCTEFCLLHGGGRCEMGNSNSTNSFWPPGKLLKRKKNSKKRKSKHGDSMKAPPVAPMYDTVADFPVYSVVDKSRQNNLKVEDNVQYADIEVIRQQTKQSQKKIALLPKPAETTEYATITFPPQINTASPYKQPNSSASQLKAPPPKNSAKQYKAPPQHVATSPKRYNASNGTLV